VPAGGMSTVGKGIITFFHGAEEQRLKIIYYEIRNGRIIDILVVET
jgi:hypothetical protein